MESVVGPLGSEACGNRKMAAGPAHFAGLGQRSAQAVMGVVVGGMGLDHGLELGHRLGKAAGVKVGATQRLPHRGLGGFAARGLRQGLCGFTEILVGQQLDTAAVEGVGGCLLVVDSRGEHTSSVGNVSSRAANGPANLRCVSSILIAGPLHNSIYRRLFAAQVIGLVGTGLATVAMGLLAFQMAGGNAGQVLGVVLALRVATYVTVSPVIAAWGGNISRKKLLVSMDLIRALAITSIAFVDQVWQFYVLIVVVSAASAGFTPAFQALIPDIFEDEETYTEALSLHRLAYEIEAVFSPLLAGFLLALISYSALFAFNGVAFLVSASLVGLTVMPPLRKQREEPRTVGQIHRGIQQFFSVPRLRGLFALDWAVAAGGAMVIINTVVFVKGEWGLGDSEVAWTLGAFGLGSMVVALMLPRVLRRVRDRSAMIFGGLLQAVALAITWLFVGSLPTLIACWVLIGAGTSMILTSSGRLIQRSGSVAERPSLFAAQFSLSHLCWLFTYPIAGFAGGALGLPVAAAILAGIATLGTLAAVFLWPAPSQTRSDV